MPCDARPMQWTNFLTCKADFAKIQISWKHGAASGTMTAYNIPSQQGPITTYWKGELVDMVHNSFSSPHHGTAGETDFAQWHIFAPFHKLKCQCPGDIDDITRSEIDKVSCIFMRWKEQSFLTKTTSGNFGSLTIAGFYYDPSTIPLSMQKLELSPSMSNKGQGFATISFA
jgi:hypothetical protein